MFEEMIDRAAREWVNPDCDGDRCVHALSAVATCRACVDVCPVSAWVLTDDGLGLDTEACDGCGLCVPACPEAAISLNRAPVLRAGEDGDVAFAICREVAAPGDDGLVPCLHALGLRDLSRLYERGVRHLVTAEAGCDDCRCGKTPRIDAAIADFAALAEDRGLPAITFTELPADEWRAALTANDMPGGLPTLSRRGLVSLLRPRDRKSAEADATETASRADALYLHVPAIDAGTCVGCDACIRICPHDALKIGRDENRRPGYAIDAGRCTGCGLCRDICEVDAVSLARMARPQTVFIALSERRCSACGAPFHEPVAADNEGAICRICRTTNHTRNLYQVLK